MVKNGESSKAAVSAPEQTPQQMFAALGNFFKIQSEACLAFAGEGGNGQDVKALADLIAGLQASGVALGGTPSGKKGPPKTAEQQERADKKRKRADKLALKDPNAPKRPASAYLMYQNECREEVKKSMPKEAPYQDTLKKIGEMWKELDAPLKQVYLDRANAAMTEFKATNEAYTNEKGDVTLNGIKAAVAAADGSDDDDEDDDEDEEDEVAPEVAAESDTESESESEDEAPPPPPPAKKSKKVPVATEAPAATPKKEKKAKAAAAAAVEAAPAKKSKKEKKASA